MDHSRLSELSGISADGFIREMGFKPRPYFDKLSNHLGRLDIS